MSQRLQSASTPFTGVPAVSTLPQPSNLTPEGRSVYRSPQQLRLHPALEELGWVGAIGELDEAVQLTNRSVTAPILIAINGTILAGFGLWRSALFDGCHEVNCIEYPLNEDESLQFIIRHHHPQRGWNAFIRIRLALNLESRFQQRALDNMHAGGKYKGSAKLPEALQIDVREKIAEAAGVCARNVSKAKEILKNAHPRLIEALRDGVLSINRAATFCRLSKNQQVEELTRHIWQCGTSNVIRQSIASPKAALESLDTMSVVKTLQQLEEKQHGSVEVRIGRSQRTVVVVGQDLLTSPLLQQELKLPCNATIR